MAEAVHDRPPHTIAHGRRLALSIEARTEHEVAASTLAAVHERIAPTADAS